MTWLTWRQHRQHLLVGLTVLAALGAAFAVLRGGLVAYVRDSGLSACLAEPDEGCGHLIDGLRAHYPSLLDRLPYLALVPALVGVFVGAPLLPRELERGTHRLVWTQSVSRTRWLLTKVGLLCAASVAFGLALGVVARWFLSPYVDGAVVSPVQRDILGLLDVAPAGYCLFAFGLGVATGALIRRTLPAMAAALAVFTAARLGWESVRYRLLPPRHAVDRPRFGGAGRAGPARLGAPGQPVRVGGRWPGRRHAGGAVVRSGPDQAGVPDLPGRPRGVQRDLLGAGVPVLDDAVARRRGLRVGRRGPARGRHRADPASAGRALTRLGP